MAQSVNQEVVEEQVAPIVAEEEATEENTAPGYVAPVKAEVIPEPIVQPVVVTPVVEVPPAAPAKVEVVTPAPVVEVTVANPMDGVSLVGKMAYQNILDYVINMAPKNPIQIDEGCRHQTRLYSSIMSIINNLDADFNKAFGALLKLIHEQKDGVFHEIQIFRFMDHIALPLDDRKAFQRIINLLKLTADPKGRALALKQVSLKNSLEFGVNESGRQRLMAFYNQK
jgi:hypothetical protein